MQSYWIKPSIWRTLLVAFLLYGGLAGAQTYPLAMSYRH